MNDGTAWMALNAVTRYVDHARSVRGVNDYGSEDAARFASGSTMKAQAWSLLMPRIADKIAA